MFDIVMFVIMCFSFTIAYLIVFGGIGYLIDRFAKGTVQKVLYAVLAFFAVFETIMFCVFLEGFARFSSIVALLASSALFVTKTFSNAVTSFIDKKQGAKGAISTLKGYHMGGLAANEGVKVSVCLFNDSIIFKSGRTELDDIDKTDIVRISSFSDQEIVGAVTTGKSRTGLASTVALMSGDLAAAYFLRPRTTTYKTKNKVKKYWFFVLETPTNSIVLQVKSRSALYYFVDLCNEVFSYDTEDYVEEEIQPSINIDAMNGSDFEHFCADLLRVNGYVNVRITAGAGDHGIDILAEKDETLWGFQCKRWGEETHIGNDVVRDTFAGKAYYHCDIAVIITTTAFTRKAEEYARETGILLWGRDKLYRLMEKMNDTAQMQ